MIEVFECRQPKNEVCDSAAEEDCCAIEDKELAFFGLFLKRESKSKQSCRAKVPEWIRLMAQV